MKKVFKIILAVLLVVITFGSAYMLGHKIATDSANREPSTVVTPEEDKPSEDIPYESAESGNMHADMQEENNLSVVLASVVEEDYALMNVPENAESCIAVQAYVMPEYATNKGVRWELSFVDPMASWVALMEQEGYTMDDYIQVIPQGNNKVALACMNPFGERIQLDIISEANPTIYATVYLDYEVRILDAKLHASTPDGEMSYSIFQMHNVEDNNTTVFNIGEYFQEVEKLYSVELITSAATYGRESILQMRLNPEFVDYLKESGIAMSDAAYEPFTNNNFANRCFALPYCGLYFVDSSLIIEGTNPFNGLNNSITQETKDAYKMAVNNYIAENGTARLITFTYYYGEPAAPKMAFNTHLGSDCTLFTFDVTSVEADTENIVF